MPESAQGASAPSHGSSNTPRLKELELRAAYEKPSPKQLDDFTADLQQTKTPDIEYVVADVDAEPLQPEEVDEEAAMMETSRKMKQAALIALCVAIIGLLSWALIFHSSKFIVLHPLHKLRHGLHSDLPAPMSELAEGTFNSTGSSTSSTGPSSPNSQASRALPRKKQKPFNPFISFEASERNRCRRLIQSTYDLDKGRLLTTVRNMLTSLTDKWRHAMGALISSAARVEREMRRRKFEALRLRHEAKIRQKAAALNQTYIPSTNATVSPLLADICPSIPTAACSNRALSPIQFRIYHSQDHCPELERFGTLFGGISGETRGFRCNPCDPTLLEWWPALRTETDAFGALSEFHATMAFGLHSPCMQWTGMAHRQYPFVSFLSHKHDKVPQWCDHLTKLGDDALSLKLRAVSTLTEGIDALKLKMKVDKQRKSALQMAKLHSSDDVTPIAAGVAAVAAAVVTNEEEEDDSWDARRVADMEENLERVNNHELKVEVDMELHARYALNPYSNPFDVQNMAVTRDDSPESLRHNPIANAVPVPTSVDWWYPSDTSFIFHLYPIRGHFSEQLYDDENNAMGVPEMPRRFREIMPDLYDIHYESLRSKTYGFASQFFVDYEAFRNYAKWVLQFTMYEATHKDCFGGRCMGYLLERSTNVYFGYIDGFAAKGIIDVSTCSYDAFYSVSDSHAGRPTGPKVGFRERIDLISDLLECHTRLDWTPPNDENSQPSSDQPSRRSFEPPAPGTHTWFPAEEWITLEKLAARVKPKPPVVLPTNTTSNLNSTNSTVSAAVPPQPVKA